MFEVVYVFVVFRCLKLFMYLLFSDVKGCLCICCFQMLKVVYVFVVSNLHGQLFYICPSSSFFFYT